MRDWLAGGADMLHAVPVSLILLYLAVLVFIRLMGLRSLSKMSGTDFITTVAAGSLLGTSIAAPDPSALQAGTGLLGLFALMLAAAWLRRHVPWTTGVMDNRPLYLMDGPRVLHDNLDHSNVTLDDLHSKLRESGVWSYEQVVAVVLERTGDVSVLTREGGDHAPEPAIFAGVTGAPGPASRPEMQSR